MDPLTLTMLLASQAGNLFGLSQSGKQQRSYDSYIKDMTNRVTSKYNQDYNTNYLDTDEAKSVLRLLTEKAKEVNDDQASSAAITGASAEKQVATKDKLNKNYTGAATQLAGYGTRRKEGIKNDYFNRMGQIDHLNLQGMMQKSQNWGQFGQNVSGTFQNALLANMMGPEGSAGATGGFSGLLKKKKTPVDYLSMFQGNELL